MKYFFENRGSFDLGIPYQEDRVPAYVSILLNHLAYNPERFDISVISGNHVSVRMCAFRGGESNLEEYQKYYPRRGEFIFTKNSKGNLSIDYRFDMGLQFLVFFVAGVLPGIFTIFSIFNTPGNAGLATLSLLFWVLLVYILCVAIVKIIPGKSFIRILINISKGI